MKRLLSIRPFSTDLALLILRVMSGGMLFHHGWAKIEKYGEMRGGFSDPIGLGSEFSLILTIFAEAVCSALLMLGLFTRLALIPLIIVMLVITFLVHGADPFGRQELPLMYLTSFVALFFTGPGRYSVDAALKR